jgi:hypothetical protein
MILEEWEIIMMEKLIPNCSEWTVTIKFDISKLTRKEKDDFIEFVNNLNGWNTEDIVEIDGVDFDTDFFKFEKLPFYHLLDWEELRGER